MINFFDFIYFKLRHNKNEIIFFKSFLRFSLRVLVNKILKIYLIFNKIKLETNKSPKINNKPLLIVSLTSFPARIENLWMVIESIFLQEKKPDRIILWLSKENFSSLDQLPNRLLNQMKRGLEIKLRDDDLKSHKKYFYALQEYPHDIVVTLDDDVIYNSKVLKTLWDLHLEFPNSVTCNNATLIKSKQNIILPYKSWSECKSSIPSYYVFPIGVGGVLYPPNSINKIAFNINTIKSTCFFADDIYLNTMTKLNNCMAVCSNLRTAYIPVLYKKNSILTEVNVNQGLNDKQLTKIREFCVNELNKDPFNFTLND